MPELPEVETVVRRLNEVLPGRRFVDLSVYKDKSFGGQREQVVDAGIDQVSRRAKIIRFHLSNGLNLVTHLKMTGQLIYVSDEIRLGGGHPTADWVHDLPARHTRIEYTLDDGAKLFFNDQRIFGWMKIMDDGQWLMVDSKLGPDINSPDLTVDYLADKLKNRSIPIKQAIMNNDIVCGVGNIYACDGLNLAKINPTRESKSLSKGEIGTLVDCLKWVIERGIELGGTTFDGKYVGIDGFAGGYQKELRVYGREGEACPNCGAEISKIKLGGRGTYYCPSCQK